MKKQLTVLAMLGTLLLGAQTVTNFNKASDWQWPAGIFKNGEITYCNQWRIVSSTPMIKIDPAAQYVFEMEAKNADASAKPAYVFFTLALYDASKREIYPFNVTCTPNTETELAEAVKAGDTVIKLKNGKNWQCKNSSSIAFNIKSDFSDLPNRDVVNDNFKSFKKDGQILEITLKTPMKKAYPAGTKVRQHVWSNDLIVCQFSATGKWFLKSGTVSGFAKNGVRNDSKWWPGAVYYRPSITCAKNKNTVLARNVKVSVKDMNSVF